MRRTNIGQKEAKIEELLCFHFCCACSKTIIASAAFNDISLVYFVQLHGEQFQKSHKYLHFDTRVQRETIIPGLYLLITLSMFKQFLSGKKDSHMGIHIFTVTKTLSRFLNLHKLQGPSQSNFSLLIFINFCPVAETEGTLFHYHLKKAILYQTNTKLTPEPYFYHMQYAT